MSLPEGLSLRPFVPADRHACLALFDSNVPKFFQEHERPAFAAFLDRLPCPFFVVADARGDIVGCGGYAPERGRLVWGMVDAARHRQGIGRFLLRSRLVHWQRAYGAAVVTLSTSQHSCGFFEREGFVTTAVTADGLAPGLDRHDLALVLDDERCRALARPPAR